MKAFLSLLTLASLAFGSEVLTGTDQITDASWIDFLKNKRVGVVAHFASKNKKGEHLVDILHNHPGIDLKIIFSPEHGFRGLSDSRVPDSVDPRTGLPVISLYGPRKAPEKKHLNQVDVILFDLQDVGVRFYTYSTTMALTMKAAKENSVQVLVLDRPNPVGGEVVEGAVLEKKLQGNFMAYYPIATRHGMTMGELAQLYNKSFGIEANLEVLPLKNWKREMLWPQTKLPWLSPSPALPTFEQAFLYSVFGSMESYPLAVGRGIQNHMAFKIFGAPWIKKDQAKNLTEKLNALKLPGLRFQYHAWTPDRREYKGQLCHGYEIILEDPKKVKGFEALLLVSQTMKRELGVQLVNANANYGLGAAWLGAGIEDLTPVSLLMEKAEQEAGKFLRQREAALMY